MNNKVLVIDEIHNLTASMVGGGFNGPKLYELIMRARNLKIVLLSGTPVINYAFELGLMMNLLRGLISSYRINIKHPSSIFNRDQIQRILKSIPQIDRFKINVRDKSIDVTRTPIGFVKSSTGNGKVVKSDLNNDPSDIYFISLIIQELSKLNIGSRPAHRSGARSKYSIRAIPWVFGWSLSRHTLPAWYGLGTAISSIINESEKLDTLKHMYQEWPYFRSLFDNIQMALSKADLVVSKDYADLVKNKKQSSVIYKKIFDEYQLSIESLLKVTENQDLLKDNEKLALSIYRRKPYLDPLNYIQVMLLEKNRLEAEHNEKLFNPLIRTIHAISTGLKNTG